jgi:hypothetical protein
MLRALESHYESLALLALANMAVSDRLYTISVSMTVVRTSLLLLLSPSSSRFLSRLLTTASGLSFSNHFRRRVAVSHSGHDCMKRNVPTALAPLSSQNPSSSWLRSVS